MKWNFKVYEEPGILFADRDVEADSAPIAQIEELMKPGIEQERVLLTVLTNLEQNEPPILCPQSDPTDETFEELGEIATKLLTESRFFEAASVADAASRGAHGQDPELQLLAASIFEHIRFYDMALPLLVKVAESFTEELRQAAIQIRLARALQKSGRMSDVSERLETPLKHPDLPPVLRVEALLLKAVSLGGSDALSILDELLDYAEEKLGDHRLVADALEYHADLLSPQEPKKAEQFYHAAGKMLVELKDPYFFSLNERFVVHFLKHKAYEEALHLSHEMFELLKQAGGPPIASVPYFVFASHAHGALGDQERKEFATKTAHDIHDIEAKRLEHLLELALN